MAKPSEMAGKAFGKARGLAKSLIEGYGGIFRHLAEEHGETSMLMRRISASSDWELINKDLFPKLRVELLSHARAEESEFYPYLRRFDATRDKVPESLREHAGVEALLTELSGRHPSEPGWKERFEELVRQVDHHVDEEENEVFVRAKDVISREEAKDLLTRFERAKAAEKHRLA